MVFFDDVRRLGAGLATAMKLDTRRPLLVLLGAWNPAIFHPNWVALHLFNYQEGDTVTFSTAVSQQDGTHTPSIYLDNIGYSATNTRLELYLQSYDEAGFSRVSDLVARLVSTLPHTPFGDFGVNFRFVEEQPSDELYDALRSADDIHHHFKILLQELKAKIDYQPGCELNFRRVPSDSLVVLDFNYHHRLTDASTLSLLNTEYLDSLFTDSLKTIERLYGLSGYEQVCHDFGGAKAEGDQP